jgi:hypothetical protein
VCVCVCESMDGLVTAGMCVCVVLGLDIKSCMSLKVEGLLKVRIGYVRDSGCDI